MLLITTYKVLFVMKNQREKNKAIKQRVTEVLNAIHWGLQRFPDI